MMVHVLFANGAFSFKAYVLDIVQWSLFVDLVLCFLAGLRKLFLLVKFLLLLDLPEEKTAFFVEQDDDF
jgi:hypothetical protein